MVEIKYPKRHRSLWHKRTVVLSTSRQNALAGILGALPAPSQLARTLLLISSMYLDQRQKRRRLASEQVSCSARERRWSASVANISSTGAFIESKDMPELHEEVSLEFSLQ